MSPPSLFSLPSSWSTMNYLWHLSFLKQIWLHQVIVAACRLQSTGPIISACKLSFPAARGILVLWPGTEPSSPALQDEFLTTGPPEKSPICGFWGKPGYLTSMPWFRVISLPGLAFYVFLFISIRFSPDSKSSATSSGKPFLIIVISAASARITHYTLSYHKTYCYSICFLECSKKIIKIYPPSMQFLAPRTQSIVISPDFWVLQKVTEISRLQAWGQVDLRTACCVLIARSCTARRGTSSGALHQKSPFIPPFARLQIRPLSPCKAIPLQFFFFSCTRVTFLWVRSLSDSPRSLCSLWHETDSDCGCHQSSRQEGSWSWQHHWICPEISEGWILSPNTCHPSLNQWRKNDLRTVCLNWPFKFNN